MAACQVALEMVVCDNRSEGSDLHSEADAACAVGATASRMEKDAARTTTDDIRRCME